MIRPYYAVEGQTLFDVCLQVYGTLNLLVKLMKDSGIPNVNHKPRSRQLFIYDDALVVNQNITNKFINTAEYYATDKGDSGYYTMVQDTPPQLVPAEPPITSPPTNTENMPYVDVFNTAYISGADGVTDFYPTTADGGSMSGNKYDIVQIEVEIKPLLNADFVWNKALGKITLLSRTLDEGQTAFIIYKEKVTP